MKLAIEMIVLFGAGYYFREVVERCRKYLRKEDPVYIRQWNEEEAIE